MMRQVSLLKVEIVRRGWLQADLARAVEMSESRLSRIVNGRVCPLEAELKRLAQALGVRLEDLPATSSPTGE